MPGVRAVDIDCCSCSHMMARTHTCKNVHMSTPRVSVKLKV